MSSWRIDAAFVAHYAHVDPVNETKVRGGLASRHNCTRGYCERGATAPNLIASNSFARSFVSRSRVFAFALSAIVCAPALAGDDPIVRPLRVAAPLEIPHATNLDLDFKSRKRNRRPGNVEHSQPLDHAPGLEPLVWPRNGDVRARLVTPELRRTPVVGWIASNLYRSRKDTGWCLEVDPGEGEYVVFYRLNLK
jgi:hypothetical protein